MALLTDSLNVTYESGCVVCVLERAARAKAGYQINDLIHVLLVRRWSVGDKWIQTQQEQHVDEQQRRHADDDDHDNLQYVTQMMIITTT